MKTTQDAAIACFCNRLATATEMLDQLQVHLADHLGSAPEVTWADAGTLGHLVNQLTESCRFLKLQPSVA